MALKRLKERFNKGKKQNENQAETPYQLLREAIFCKYTSEFWSTKRRLVESFTEKQRKQCLDEATKKGDVAMIKFLRKCEKEKSQEEINESGNEI